MKHDVASDALTATSGRRTRVVAFRLLAWLPFNLALHLPPYLFTVSDLKENIVNEEEEQQSRNMTPVCGRFEREQG